MRGPLGGGRPKNWRSQGPKFGPISPQSSIRPRYVNQTQRETPQRAGGIGS